MTSPAENESVLAAAAGKESAATDPAGKESRYRVEMTVNSNEEYEFQLLAPGANGEWVSPAPPMTFRHVEELPETHARER